MSQQVTLEDIGQRALTDKVFFESLLKSPERTLQQYEMILSAPTDLEKLKRALKYPTDDGFELKKFIEAVHANGLEGLFSSWHVGWARGWFPGGKSW